MNYEHGRRWPTKAFLVLADKDGPIVGYEIPEITSLEIHMQDDIETRLGMGFTPYIPWSPYRVRITLESRTLIQHEPASTPEPEWTEQPAGQIEPPRKEIPQ